MIQALNCLFALIIAAYYYVFGCIVCIIYRQFNFLIFPAPLSKYDWNYERYISEGIKTVLKEFFNKNDQRVPYMEISSVASRKKKQVIIYFHGNAEDIYSSIDFCLSIFRSTGITIFCLQYPTYGVYTIAKPYFISDKIKSDSVQFHNHVRIQYNKNTQNIHIIGRSIGTGPASYLASKVKCSKLTLISPFDSIRKVSIGMVGWCLGRIVKNHFDNEESIRKHQGQLLVIHGKCDEVINFNHGKALVAVYENEQPMKKCTFIQPVRMSHNNFDIESDITKPINNFLSSNQMD